MVKDTFSRTKPSANLLPAPPFDVQAMEAYTDESTSAFISFSITQIDLTGFKILFYSSPIVSKGVMRIKESSLKFTAAVNGIISMSTIDDGEAYFSRFGAPAIGTKVFCKLIAVNSTTGQRFVVGTYSALFQEP